MALRRVTAPHRAVAAVHKVVAAVHKAVAVVHKPMELVARKAVVRADCKIAVHKVAAADMMAVREAVEEEACCIPTGLEDEVMNRKHLG